MEFTTIIQSIATIGFPIVACLLVGYYVKYTDDKHREEMQTLNAQHKEETEKLTQALNNNTLVMQKLSDRIELVLKGSDKE